MPNTRDPVFSRLTVDHLARGGTRVSYTFFYQAHLPHPHVFQLQVGHTGVGPADDWVDVGAPIEDAFVLVDPVRRLTGTELLTHYRVACTAGAGAGQRTYLSPPAGCFGTLNLHDWLHAREIVRKEALRFGAWSGVTGWLLKRRREGPTQPAEDAADPRTMITDPLTGEILRRQTAPSTVGTEFLGGFYAPTPILLGKEPGGQSEKSDLQRGNVDDPGLAVPARLVLIPAVAHKDVFVEEGSDLRYEIENVRVVAQVRALPLLGTCELRLIPYSDLIYKLPVGP